MKHLLLLTMMLLVGLSACKDDCESGDCDETPTVTKSFTVSGNTADISGSADDAELNAKVTFTNTSTTDEDISVRWEVMNQNLPSGWNSAVCDNVTCHAPTVMDRTMTITKDETFDFKVTFYPDGNSGTGTVDVKLYVEGDEENTTEMITFSATGVK